MKVEIYKRDVANMSDEEVKANADRVFGNDLATRAVGCKAWRWMPGMLVQAPEAIS